MKGRKRHLLVDTLGLVWGLLVHSAGIQDRDGARQLLTQVQAQPQVWGRLQKIWADGAYAGKLEDWVSENLEAVLEIVRRPEGTKGFQVLPKRWIGERTLAWISRCRRFSRDYEFLPETSEHLIYITMSRLMARRLAA